MENGLIVCSSTLWLHWSAWGIHCWRQAPPSPRAPVLTHDCLCTAGASTGSTQLQTNTEVQPGKSFLLLILNKSMHSKLPSEKFTCWNIAEIILKIADSWKQILQVGNYICTNAYRHIQLIYSVSPSGTGWSCIYLKLAMLSQGGGKFWPSTWLDVLS